MGDALTAFGDIVGVIGIVIAIILGLKALKVASEQLRFAVLQEQRYIDSQKTIVECVLDPRMETELKKGHSAVCNIRFINKSTHPVAIKALWVTHTGNTTPIEFRSTMELGEWTTYFQVPAQWEAGFCQAFDPLRSSRFEIELTTGERFNVKLPDWWGTV